jgi:hypothetical protein
MSRRVWRGPAANEFEDQVRTYAGRVNQQAQSLNAVAADFDRLAGRKESEAGDMRTRAALMETTDPVGGVI